MNDIIKFGEWLRVNFENSPTLRDDLNLWYDIHYTIDIIESKKYTTEELYEWWIENIYNKK